jgi:hypothetical protein
MGSRDAVPDAQWNRKNNDSVDYWEGGDGKVNVKFWGSGRFLVEKVMRRRKILDKGKRCMVFPSATYLSVWF